jgi:hypothetical protein
VATLVFGGDARGNDSHEIRVSPGVRNDLQATFGIQPDDDPSLFVMVVVLKRQGSFVIKTGSVSARLTP